MKAQPAQPTFHALQRTKTGLRALIEGSRAETGVKFALERLLAISKPQPDIHGVDLVGRLLRKCDTSRQYAHVHFGFQVKTGSSFRIATRRLRELILDTETLPIFLIHASAQNETSTSITVRFLNLHLWVLQNPRRVKRILTETTQYVTLRIAEFAPLQRDDRNLAEALTAEAQRICRVKGAVFRTTRNLRIPIRATLLPMYIGRLRQIEITSDLLVSMSRARRFDSDHAWDTLNRAIERFEIEKGMPRKLQQWIAQLRAPPSTQSEDLEAAEIIRFTTSLLNFSKGRRFYIPEFRGDIIGCWRLFAQIFPESLAMFEAAAKSPAPWSAAQRLSNSLILSSLATVDDHMTAALATDIVRKFYKPISESSHSFRNYLVNRQHHYATAETLGSRAAIARFVDFLDRHELEWDLKLHRLYYDSPNSNYPYVLAADRKLSTPRKRDERTAQIAQYYLERMPPERLAALRAQSPN